MKNVDPSDPTNPFIQEHPLPVKVITKDYRKVKENTEYCRNRIEFGSKVIALDDQPFIKVYDGTLGILGCLNPVEHVVVSYIMEQMFFNITRYKSPDGVNQYHTIDYIPLSSTKLAKVLNTSKSTISKALKTLVKLQLLCKGHTQPYYWINPHKLFIGDRASRYKDHLNVINNDAERKFAYQ